MVEGIEVVMREEEEEEVHSEIKGEEDPLAGEEEVDVNVGIEA